MVDISVLIPARLFMSSNITSSSLTLFFKPIFTLRTLHTFFMSQIIARWTIPTSSFLRFKWMSILAIYLSCIDSLKTISSKSIYLWCNKFKMIWIATGMITTKMIKLDIFPSRYFSFIKSKYNSMYSFSSTSIKTLSVSLLILSTNPVPTISFFINNYFIKKSFIFFWRECNIKKFHNIYYTTL